MNTRHHFGGQTGSLLLKCILSQSILGGFFMLVTAGLTPDLAMAQGNGQDQVQAYLERTDELLIWAKDLVSETQSVPARQVLAQAADLQRRSQNLLGNGRNLEALGVSRRSRAAVWRAVRLARESMNYEERIRIRVERFRDQHSQLTERALEVGDRQALEFLERAEHSANRAREQYQQGDFQLSWKMLEQAGNLMQRAARLLADGTTPERLELEMERARMLIERTRDNLADNPDPQAMRLLAEAEESLVRAREGMDQGQPGRALQMTGLARQLAIRAASLSAGGPNDEAAKRQLERFDERAGQVADGIRDSGSKQARTMYEKALGHRTRAAEALDEGNSEMALRQIKAAHDLLGQAEDLIRR
jgi:hypothetical protein